MSSSDRRSPGDPEEPRETTELLAAARDGDRSAYDEVFARVYDELRRVASRQAARLGAGDSLATTALVHEAYLKLVGQGIVASNDRVHFFALAARAMRQILVDHLRHRGRRKRGGAAAHLPLERVEVRADAGGAAVEDLLALDSALGRLEAVDDELGRLVEWRFFAGLTLEEIAGMTGTSERTLKRDWQVARSFLLRELSGVAPGAGAEA